MTVKNWRKKVAAYLVAAGMLSPSAVRAIDIPLGDPSFEAYVVPAIGYAYSTEYRPTSAWIDDPDSPGDGYFEDDGLTGDRSSSWLYNGTYANAGPPLRAFPRTGNQAMHGITHYSGQEAGAVFEAGKTYTFSVYSQGDDDGGNDNSRVWLYLYNGSAPFSEANSLAFKKYTVGQGDFVNRPASSSGPQSQALWQKISISHTVQPGAPEVGQPIGVAFWGADDAGVDDASLSADVTALTLIVNTVTGVSRIVNETGQPVSLDYYQISSAGSSLNEAAWNSLQEQNLAGFPAGNGTGNGWEEAGGASDKALGESFLTGNSQLAAGGAPLTLGPIFATADPQDLVFQYGKVSAKIDADFDANAVVDGADLLKLQRGLSSFGGGVTKASGNANTDLTVNGQDFSIFKSQFGNTSAPEGVGVLTRGVVRYVTSGIAAVPEPTSVVLASLAGLTLFGFGRKMR